MPWQLQMYQQDAAMRDLQVRTAATVRHQTQPRLLLRVPTSWFALL